jgi:hypothetical protein
MDIHSLRVISGIVGCEASCPHCSYRKGTKSGNESEFDFKRFEKARKYAVRSGVVALEIEAKGDPLRDEWTKLYQILSEATPDFPQIGLTTPGKYILEAQDSFVNLVGWHLTNLTLTIPHHEPKKRRGALGLNLEYDRLINYLREDCQVVVRASCALSKVGISSPEEALAFIGWCREIGIRHVVFREISMPGEGLDQEAAQWCLSNAVELDFRENWSFDDSTNRVFYVNSLLAQNEARPLFVFPWGETAYEINGVNVVFEKSEETYYGKSFKSLLLSGSHLYARYESEGSILF